MDIETLQDVDPLADLRSQQRAWVIGYLEHGDRVRAAREAHYANPAVAAWRNMRNPRIVGAIRKFREAIPDDIADTGEILTYLSSVMRGGAPVKDRSAAAVHLLKAQGVLGADVDARHQTVNVSIGKDAPIEILDAVDLLRRVSLSESSPFAAEAREVLTKILPGVEKVLTPPRE